MLVETNQSNKLELQITNTNSLKAVAAKIRSNATNFRAATSYHSPLHACPREWFSNAADAMVRAGKSEEPFISNAPTLANPVFDVRDFGSSMTPGEFQEYVIDVGSSSKRNCSDQVGGFGRGLYAPLGFTDAFWVECYKDGMVYRHQCVLSGCESHENLCGLDWEGEAGVPLWFVDESGTPTDQEDGTKFCCAIPAKHIKQFCLELQNITMWFGHPKSHYKTRPQVHGIETVELEESLMTQDFAMIPSLDQSVVVMGNVPYPINLRGAVREELGYELSNWVTSARIALFLPLSKKVGEKLVQPVVPNSQRDGLEYVPRTLNTLKECIATAKKQLFGLVTKALNDCDNEVEARLLYHSSFRTTLYSGMQLTWRKRANMEERISSCDERTRWVDGSTRRKQRLERVRILTAEISTRGRCSTEVMYSISNYDLERIRDRKICLVLKDVDESDAKMRSRIKNSKLFKFIIVKEFDNHANWLSRHGLDKFARNLSEFPLPEKNSSVRVAGDKKTSTELLWRSERDAAMVSDVWRESKVDWNEGGIFVEVNRYDVILKGLTYTGMIMNNWSRSFLQVPAVVGLRSQAFKSLKKDPERMKKWQSLDDWTENILRIKAKRCLRLVREADDLNYWSYSMQKMDAAFSLYSLVPGLIRHLKSIRDRTHDRIEELEEMRRLIKNLGRLYPHLLVDKRKTTSKKLWLAAEERYGDSLTYQVDKNILRGLDELVYNQSFYKEN